MDRLAEGSHRNCEENGWYVLHSSAQYFRSLFAVLCVLKMHLVYHYVPPGHYGCYISKFGSNWVPRILSEVATIIIAKGGCNDNRCICTRQL